MRTLFGQLLAEIQRIKSEGDFEAARKLVEKDAVKIDPVLHAEILARYEKLHLAPYKGFVNPVYCLLYTSGESTPVFEPTQTAWLPIGFEPMDWLYSIL